MSIFGIKKKSADAETVTAVKVGADERTLTVEKAVLRLSGMRGTVEYEIICGEGGAEVSFYIYRYGQETEIRELDSRAVCGGDVIVTLFNDCSVISWDGFYGPHPRDVLDGMMFDLEAYVNGGRRIHASGSENFPPHFRDFENGIYEILKGGK